jgi:uncharacterized NAD-dependent epimerase/dehydratase family protein
MILSSKNVILADGLFRIHKTKTAMGIIRNTKLSILAVIDRSCAGSCVGDIKGTEDNIPIIGDIKDVLAKEPKTLVIGAYPKQGILPEFWKKQILYAVERGMNIVSWFHRPLTYEPMISKAVKRNKVKLFDVRQPPKHLKIAQDIPHPKNSFTILTVGSDCAVGKMTTSLAIQSEAKTQNINCDFVATGQAGIILSGKGSCIDNIPGDYIAGEIEKLLISSLKTHKWAIVEGQGALIHPAFSGVALSLLHSARPDALILCHNPTRTKIHGSEIPIPPLADLVQLYQIAASWVNPAPVVGIALNCQNLPDIECRKIISHTELLTRLPVTDCRRFGAKKLVDKLKFLYNCKIESTQKSKTI